jgi:hypothetical protein
VCLLAVSDAELGECLIHLAPLTLVRSEYRPRHRHMPCGLGQLEPAHFRPALVDELRRFRELAAEHLL